VLHYSIIGSFNKIWDFKWSFGIEFFIYKPKLWTINHNTCWIGFGLIYGLVQHDDLVKSPICSARDTHFPIESLLKDPLAWEQIEVACLISLFRNILLDAAVYVLNSLLHIFL
jgi:hypothetical protein